MLNARSPRRLIVDPRRRRAPSRGSVARRDATTGWLFVSPMILGFLVFVLVPLIGVIYFSFHKISLLSGAMKFIGFDNYERLGTEQFGQVALNTVLFAGGVVPLNVAIGLGLAVLINRSVPGIGLIRGLFFVPVIISLVAWAVVWRYLLQQNGGINGLLAVVGIEGPNWLYDANFTMIAMIFVQVVKMVGLSMIFFLAALQAIPPELYESARVDGAGPWQRMRNITIPLVSPTILMVTILVTVWSLKAFAQILLLTQGGPAGSTTILGFYIYQQAFKLFDTGFASALAVVLFVITAVVTILQWSVRKKWVHED